MHVYVYIEMKLCMHVVVEANLCESFGSTGLRAEEDGDLLCAIVNFQLRRFHDQRLERLHGFWFGTVGSPPNQDDDAADEDRNGGGQNHYNLTVLEDKGSHLVCGVGRHVGGVHFALDDCRHEIQRRAGRRLHSCERLRTPAKETIAGKLEEA